jgi:tryptophan synthase alpha chain
MRPSEHITAAIERQTAAGKLALVGFITAGFPTRADFVEQLEAVMSACDVVEIGVPFSDPMADGSTVQHASFVALQGGVTLPWILETLARRAPHPAPVLLMSYLNPLLRFGVESLPAAAARAGVAGCIVPDLPYEERAELGTALEREGLALVQMVSPVTPAPRLARLCAHARGFVYAVTMTGTTGQSAEVPDSVLEYMDRVKRVSPVPVCAGFGIRSASQVRRFAGHVDGVVIGSALLEAVERGDDVRAFLGSLR